MKKLYRMILNEMLGPWVFGVAIFTTLIVTMVYLFQLTEMVVRGVSLATVIYLALLFIPAILAKTFAMAALLAALLAFGRLSGDSEVVALRAAGISIGRIMVPVAGFSVVVAAIAFYINEQVAPAATQRAESLKGEISKQLRAEDLNPTGYPIRDKNGKLVAQMCARDFSPAQNTLRGVTMIVYDTKTSKPTFYLYAGEMQYIDDKEWKVVGGGYWLSADRKWGTTFSELWPEQIRKLDATPQEILAAMEKNLDSFSKKQFRVEIKKAKHDKIDEKQIRNLEYGYYNKIALPLAVMVFGLVGAPLGIRQHRAGVAAGYMISIVIIFGYFLLTNLMAVFATRGPVPPYVASFLPVAVGLVIAVVTIHQRNQA